MKFWDASALLCLAVRDGATERMETLLRRDPEIVIWWGTPVDCASALAAAQRQGRLTEDDLPKARGVIDHLRQRAFEIQALEEVRARALRILSLHPLRSPQALELAAALVWCRERTTGVSFVSAEAPLRYAAAREGFRVLPYADEVHEPDDEQT